MMLKVVYVNEKHDMVKDYLLDRFIETGKIRKFKRSDGWVTVGVDLIRGKGGPYNGPERRNPSDLPSATI